MSLLDSTKSSSQSFISPFSAPERLMSPKGAFSASYSGNAFTFIIMAHAGPPCDAASALFEAPKMWLEFISSFRDTQ